MSVDLKPGVFAVVAPKNLPAHVVRILSVEEDNCVFTFPNCKNQYMNTAFDLKFRRAVQGVDDVRHVTPDGRKIFWTNDRGYQYITNVKDAGPRASLQAAVDSGRIVLIRGGERTTPSAREILEAAEKMGLSEISGMSIEDYREYVGDRRGGVAARVVEIDEDAF